MAEIAEQDTGHPPPPAPEQRGWRMRWWWVLLGLLVLLMALYFGFRLMLMAEVDARLDAIRAAGYPATAEELDDWYEHVPEDENAAVVLLDAFGWMKVPDRRSAPAELPWFGEAELPPVTQPLPDEMAAAIETLLADNAEALERLHKGAAMERSRYPVDLSKGVDAMLPHLSELQTVRRLLALEAIWHAENGRTQEAAQSVRAMFGVARSLESEPTLMSQLMRFALQRTAVQALERVVHQVELDDETLAGLIEDVADAERFLAVERAMAGERVMLSGMFTSSIERLSEINGRLGDLSTPLLKAHRFSGTMQIDHLVYLELSSENLAASKLPTHQRIAAFEAVEKKITDAPFYAPLTTTFMPSFTVVASIDLRTIAQLRVARVALAVERYRRAHGELPGELSELAPEFIDALPADPFTGKPLKYEKREGGFTVYSVGEDKADDGGAKTNADGKEFGVGTDIPFTIKHE